MDIWKGISKNMPKTIFYCQSLLIVMVPNKRVGFVVKERVLKP